DDRHARGLLAKFRAGVRETFLHGLSGDFDDVHAGAALCFVSLPGLVENLPGHGGAEVRGEQCGFDFIEGRARELGREGDDTLDLMYEPGVGFLQAGLEFLKKTHRGLTIYDLQTAVLASITPRSAARWRTRSFSRSTHS